MSIDDKQFILSLSEEQMYTTKKNVCYEMSYRRKESEKKPTG